VPSFEPSWSILSWSVLISTSLILAVVALFKNVIREWLVTRIRSGIQHDFDTKLETVKAEIAHQNEKSILKLSNDMQMQNAYLDTVRLSFSEGQRSSMKRKLDSVDKLWSEVLKLRKLTMPGMSFVDLFKESETQKFGEFKKSESGIAFLPRESVEESKQTLQTVSPDLEEIRPYISEYLWVLLNCYREIHLRLCIFLRSDEDEQVIGWYKDDKTYQIVVAVLDEEELAYFNELQIGKFSWLNEKVEYKMLSELRHIVSGQHFAQDALGKINTNEIEKMRQAAMHARR